MLRIVQLMTSAGASLRGERREFDKTLRLDVLEGMVWLVVAVVALFLLAAVLGGPLYNAA